MQNDKADRPSMSSGTGCLVHVIIIMITSFIWGSFFWEDALYSDSSIGSAVWLGLPMIIGMVSWAVFQTKHNKADVIDANLMESGRREVCLEKFRKLEEDAAASPGRVMSELMDFITEERRHYQRNSIDYYEFVLLGKLMVINGYTSEYYRFLDSFIISSRRYVDDKLVEQYSEQAYSLTQNEITKIRIHVKELVDETYKELRIRQQEAMDELDQALEGYLDKEGGIGAIDARVVDEDPFAASKKGKTYHERACSVLSKVNEDMIITFESMSDAENNGYELCSYCRKRMRKRKGFKT